MKFSAAIAQLGERQTEDLEVLGSIPGLGIVFANVVKGCSCFLICAIQMTELSDDSVSERLRSWT